MTIARRRFKVNVIVQGQANTVGPTSIEGSFFLFPTSKSNYFMNGTLLEALFTCQHLDSRLSKTFLQRHFGAPYKMYSISVEIWSNALFFVTAKLPFKIVRGESFSQIAH